MRLPGELHLPREIFAMNNHDLDGVLALEASVEAFPWSRGNFMDSMAAGHRVKVCCIGGDLIGFSVVMNVLDEAHLLNVAVAAGHQRKGHGAFLMLDLMETAARDGATTMFLEVRLSNQRAIDLYRHLGFVQVGQRRDYYPAPSGREDALVLQRKLP